MNDHFEHDAHDYLLRQMDATRRAVFEQQLARSAEARTALKVCADALAAFASVVAPPEPLSAAEQRAALDTILAATQSPPHMAAIMPAHRGTWLRYFWPAAALLLLALNLIEFHRPLSPSGSRESVARPDRKTPTPATDSSGQREPKRFAQTPPAPTPPMDTASRPSSSAPTDATGEIARLREELAASQRLEQKIRLDYEALLERLADRAVLERQLNRLTTMELVDGGSFARGERKGLVGVGRNVLTEPGVVVAPEPPPSPTDTAATAARPAYAWSVFDEKENRGYLNLYRLPTVSTDQVMQLWVKPAESKAFQPVSEVPRNFQGRGGYLEYTLPAGATPPAEILITVEPRGTLPPAPSGPTVLRGP